MNRNEGVIDRNEGVIRGCFGTIRKPPQNVDILRNAVNRSACQRKEPVVPVGLLRSSCTRANEVGSSPTVGTD